MDFPPLCIFDIFIHQAPQPLSLYWMAFPLALPSFSCFWGWFRSVLLKIPQHLNPLLIHTKYYTTQLLQRQQKIPFSALQCDKSYTVINICVDKSVQWKQGQIMLLLRGKCKWFLPRKSQTSLDLHSWCLKKTRRKEGEEVGNQQRVRYKVFVL